MHCFEMNALGNTAQQSMRISKHGKSATYDFKVARMCCVAASESTLLPTKVQKSMPCKLKIEQHCLAQNQSNKTNPFRFAVAHRSTGANGD